MSNLDLTNLVLKTHYGANTVINDDAGVPSVMVFIPKFNLSDVITGAAEVPHPAFLVSDTVLDGIYVSKYINTLIDGRAYSWPAEDPAHSLTLAEAQNACFSKGNCWHLMNAWEWAAIALWCKKNGYFPKGNNDTGKDASESEYVAICSEDNLRTLTGTGPVTWSHNGKLDGIYDLNGNTREWCDGLRLVRGELQVQRPDDSLWYVINAETGGLCNILSAEYAVIDTVKAAYIDNSLTWTANQPHNASSKSTKLSDVVADDTISEEAKIVLISLALLPDGSFDYGDDAVAIQFNTTTTHNCTRGGFSKTSPDEHSGVFCTEIRFAEAAKAPTTSFRSVYYKF